jgi:glutaconate CoA-transferase subunit B|tara:strand:+ start:241318 stop:242103 length:786 start_codon:yes stop_codon:yes gene_type:complete
MTDEYTLADVAIVACADAFRGNGEIIASAFGAIPRVGAGLAKLTHTPELMMTDGEAFLVEEPRVIGGKVETPELSGYMNYSRVFDIVWSGRRHVMIGPLQIDRWGQTNLSAIGDYNSPKIAMLGMRGLPGNSINHINSMYAGHHSKRMFVEGEVDVVCGVGYNPDRWAPGMNRDAVDMRRIVTNLCVMDFEGPDHAIRVRSLHPGVTFDQVQEATGFPLLRADDLGESPPPTPEEMTVIERLDPKNTRASAFKENPTFRRN